jgi:hypothetical protein
MGGNSKAILTGGCLPLNTGSVASCLRRIGGVSAILLLVEASDTPELLVKSLQLLMSLVQGNAINTSDMENAKGYEIIGYFLKETQQHFVTVEVMDSLFEFAGFRKDSPRTSVIANTLAFKHLLLDYEIWKSRPLAVQKVYFQRLQDFIYDNVQKIFNVWRMQSLRKSPPFTPALSSF